MPNPPSPSPAPLPTTAYQLAASPEHLCACSGEVGITLSLLQGFAGSGGDAMTWMDSQSDSEKGVRSGRSPPLISPYRDWVDTAKGLGRVLPPTTSPIRPAISSPDSCGPSHRLLPRSPRPTRPSSDNLHGMFYRFFSTILI